ncbi:OmpA family protein [Croceimicrobium sp.]|uniref:OmpA family protein n=1 Tax=Croceimicrobium sp. TaxID=2828340 RepID=UPI003BAC531D
MKRLGLLFGCVLMAGGMNAQDNEVRLSEAHRSNFKHWSLGLNVGATASLGDAASYFFGEKTDAMPSGVGGFEIGLRGNLNYWFSPTIGLTGSAGYHSTSGTDFNYYFEGNYIDADLSLNFNLSNMFLYGKDYDRKHALLFSIGLGATSLEAEGYDEAGNFLASAGGPDRAFTTTIPLQLTYKRQLSQTWDLDILYKHTFAGIDGADAQSIAPTADFFGYFGVGAAYNFGSDDKESIVYYSPFEGVFADMTEIKQNYEKLVNDDDGDGVSNLFDEDNSTPADVNVGPNGAPLDVDGDGIPDYLDADPFTPKGAKVDNEGRMVDSDGDGVGDHMDQEPNTPKGALVNFKGISVASAASGGGGVGAYLPSVFFNFNSATVTDANYLRLAAIANTLKSNPNVKIVLTGYTDASGPEDYNKTLGQRRADEVKQELVQVFGISADRIETSSKGENDPLAKGHNNINRRVDVAVK